MKRKQPISDKKQPEKEFIFGRRNYTFMFLGIALIALGYILMAGGGSDDPKVFNEAMFSFRRIRLAPMLILAGFIVEIFAILTPSKKG